MNKHPVDISALAGYIASGGLASVAGVFAIVWPGHAALITAIAVAAAAIAGAVRVWYNPTAQGGPTVSSPPFTEITTPSSKGTTP